MDRDHLTELYERYGPVVLRRAAAILRHDDDARDAMQEVFLQASRALPEDPEAQLPWLYRVTTNQCLSMIRRRKVRDRKAPMLARSEPPRGEDIEVDRQTAAAILDRFDRKTQIIVVHHHIDGMTMEEVAAITGLSRKTVSKRLVQFRVAARRILAG